MVESAILPILADDSFKPVRIRLIAGKAELLPGLYIIKKLDIGICIGSDRFQVGQGEWIMVTFNGERRRVFPLVPTACPCKKSDGYFGKLPNAKITYLQAQVDFGDHLEVRKVIKT